MRLNDGDSAVPEVNYGVIRSWINYWQKDLLEEPKEVLLGSEYLGNVVPEARSALEKWLLTTNPQDERGEDADGSHVRLKRQGSDRNCFHCLRAWSLLYCGSRGARCP